MTTIEQSERQSRELEQLKRDCAVLQWRIERLRERLDER